MISSIGSISTASIGMQALASLRAPSRSTEIKPVEKVVRREPPRDPFDLGEGQEDEDRDQLLRDLDRSAARPVIVEANQEGAGSEGKPEANLEANVEGNAGVSEEAKPEAGGAGEGQPAVEAELLPEERKQVNELKQRDSEVRQHEAAHKAAAGQYGGGATFTYQTGPDGNRYAVGGEVSIDTAPVSGDPQATIAKMQQIQRAAQAPAEPSSQDRQVAAQAAQAVQKARSELAEQRRSEQSGEGEDEAGQASASRFAGGSTFADIYKSELGAVGETSTDESLDLVA